MSIIDPIIDTIDGLLGWVGFSFGQWTECYCKLESAEDNYNLVARDGSLVSILKIDGITLFSRTRRISKNPQRNKLNSLQTGLSRNGQGIQVFFKYNNEEINKELKDILTPAIETANRINLNLKRLI